MKTFVLDVNAWVSVFYRDKQLLLVRLIEDGDIDIFTSIENISEFADVHSKHSKIRRLLPLHTSVYAEAMEEISQMFTAQKRYALLPDYKDNYLIDLAYQAGATLVTNDRHFKIAKKLRSPKIAIITVQEFYKMIGA